VTAQKEHNESEEKEEKPETKVAQKESEETAKEMPESYAVRRAKPRVKTRPRRKPAHRSGGLGTPPTRGDTGITPVLIYKPFSNHPEYGFIYYRERVAPRTPDFVKIIVKPRKLTHRQERIVIAIAKALGWLFIGFMVFWFFALLFHISLF